MKKFYLFTVSLCVLLSVSSVAQVGIKKIPVEKLGNPNGFPKIQSEVLKLPKGKKLNSKIKQLAAGDCQFIDPLFTNLSVDTAMVEVEYTDGSTGVIVAAITGTNIFGDKQKAEFYDFSALDNNNYLNGVLIYFAFSEGDDLTKIVPVRVYDGTGGVVGAEIGHTDLTMKEIADSVEVGSYNGVDFTNIALPASKKVFISVDLSNLNWRTGDLVVVYSSALDELPVNTAWEQWSDNGWYSIEESWGRGTVSLAMIPLVGFDNTCTQIVTPVTLSSFSANRFGTANKLVWSTATEAGSKGFEVQRSADGVNFTTIAFVPSQAVGGNSSSILNYSYADNSVLPNNNYYRIKQVDLSSKTTFSKTLLLFTDKLKKQGIVQAYPNPVKNNLNLILDLPTGKNNTLTVVDLAGRTLLQKSVQGSNGNQTTTLNVANLSKGTYFVKLAGEGENKLVKFIKE